MSDRPVPFVEYLEQLRDRDDRGALAALRRGLGKPAGASVEVLPYVVPWLPQDAQAWEEEPYFTVASLFAAHPKPGGIGTMGTVLGRIAREGGSASVERRFMALLNSHPEDLPERLRHAVALARSRDIPVNWHQLFRDLRGWGHPDRYVQRRWARDFWGQVDVDNRDTHASAGGQSENQERKGESR